MKSDLDTCTVCRHEKKFHTAHGCTKCLYTGIDCFEDFITQEKGMAKSVDQIKVEAGLKHLREGLEKNDLVNHPKHYTTGNSDNPVEVIHYLEDKLSPEEFIGLLKGNVLKYLSRAGKKDDTLQDYKKAQWYMNRLIATMEKPVK